MNFIVCSFFKNCHFQQQKEKIPNNTNCTCKDILCW